MIKLDRRGLTALELLVGVGVVAVLMALALPALAGVRERHRHAHCKAKLRDLGIAIMGYEAAHGQLPAGGGRSRLFPGSALIRLLPYVGQSSTYEALNLESLDYWLMDGVQVDPTNLTAATTRIGEFLCPSDGESPSGTNYAVSFGRGPHWTRIQGASTEPILVGTEIKTSPWLALRTRRLGQFRNGLAKVALMSERIQGDRLTPWLNRRRDILAPIVAVSHMTGEPFGEYCGRLESAVGEWAPHYSDFGASWLAGDVGMSAYTHAMTPNCSTMDCGVIGAPSLGAISARSQHPTGVSTLLADGRVETFSSEIDIQLWKRLSVIDDGRLDGDL